MNGEENIVRSAASKDTKSHRSRDVDAYVESAPKAARPMLVQLRKIIKAAAPGATEGISYRMPYYNYNGALVWFAAFKNHLGFFVRPPVIQEHKKELKGYETTKSTVRFPIGKPLPVALIRKLVKARVAKNEDAIKKR
jgi:uncharacterized protein YdhG (YjbR/CyaY superfamily)